MAKSFGWCVTQWLRNKPYDSDEYRDHLRSLPEFLYAGYGLEGFETNVDLHIQMCIVFSKPVGMATMRRYFPNAHVTNMREDLTTNILYCRKEGLFSEVARPSNSEYYYSAYFPKQKMFLRSSMTALPGEEIETPEQSLVKARELARSLSLSVVPRVRRRQCKDRPVRASKVL